MSPADLTLTVLDVLAAISLAAGVFFMFVAAVGVVRLPDVYHRLHAASKASTLGLLGLLLGAVFHIGTLGVLTKAGLILLFAFIATPIGSHILAKAAHRVRSPLWKETLDDELARDLGEDAD